MRKSEGNTDSKQSEKDYLRSGSLDWERVKPFAPGGSQTHDESVRLIHDFAVAVQALELLPGHRVLDLGVGAGWTTEWLRCLNVDVTGVDIAHDMLLVGKSRIGGKHRVQVGIQLLDESGRVVNREYARARLPRDIAPHQDCVVRCEVPRPEHGGALRVAMVVENLTWLDTVADGGGVVTLPA